MTKGVVTAATAGRSVTFLLPAAAAAALPPAPLAVGRLRLCFRPLLLRGELLLPAPQQSVVGVEMLILVEATGSIGVTRRGVIVTAITVSDGVTTTGSLQLLLSCPPVTLTRHMHPQVAGRRGETTIGREGARGKSGITTGTATTTAAARIMTITTALRAAVVAAGAPPQMRRRRTLGWRGAAIAAAAKTGAVMGAEVTVMTALLAVVGLTERGHGRGLAAVIDRRLEPYRKSSNEYIFFLEW